MGEGLNLQLGSQLKPFRGKLRGRRLQPVLLQHSE